MQPDLQFVPSRRLLRELAARAPKSLRAYLARGRRAAGTAATDFVFGAWRVGDRDVPLSSTYRASIKHWARYFWQTDLLLRLARRVALPDAVASLARTIEASRTLPVPLDEVAAALSPLAARHADLVHRVVRASADGAPVWELTPTGDEVKRLAAAYRAHALRVLERCGIAPAARSRASVLEIGSGTGYATMAMAGLGVGEAIGVDMDLEACAGGIERTIVSRALCGEPDSSRRVRFETGDAHRLACADRSLDVIHHASVLEHLADPGVALREMYRVLKPGGVAWMEVDPWFAPSGGHMMCTLDFPWGHARIGADDFERYVRTHRPHEAEYALAFYRNGFQQPRLTMGAIEARVVAAGFRIEDWQESRARFAGHYHHIEPALLDDCVRLQPAVEVRDLMTTAYSMVLRKD